MKKLTIAIVMLMFLISLASINVLAEDEITTDAVIEQETQDLLQDDIDDPTLEDVGTTPDQAGYGLKVAMEKVRLALTFNRAKKAELALQLSELRVREARLMMAEDKLESLEKSRSQYRKYIDLAEKNIDKIDDDNDLEEQAKLRVRLDEQSNQIDELESVILIKANGLSDAQKEKLLALIEEFKSQNQDVEVRFNDKNEAIKIKLKARGSSEEEIKNKFDDEVNKTKNLTREDILKRKAQHQVNQAQKMYDLSSKLIEKAKGIVPSNETNSTINQARKFEIREKTLELHKQALEKLNEAKSALDSNEFLKAIEKARESKKLSALTIASIHGKLNEAALEKRIDKIMLEKEKERLEVLRERQKNLLERERELKDKLREKTLDEKDERDDDKNDDDGENEDEGKCIEKEGLCCMGDNCVVTITDCLPDKVPAFKGCNDSCMPIIECN